MSNNRQEDRMENEENPRVFFDVEIGGEEGMQYCFQKCLISNKNSQFESHYFFNLFRPNSLPCK